MNIDENEKSPSIIIIDDSEDMRLLVRHYILVEWAGAKIEDWDPLLRGKPSAKFAWRSYDAVLLDYMLGNEDGLVWLKEFRRNPDCPPVIFMTGQGSEDIAVKALKAGAHDYLRKHDLSQGRLVGSIRDAISESEIAPPRLAFELPELPVVEPAEDDKKESKSILDAMAVDGAHGLRQTQDKREGLRV